MCGLGDVRHLGLTLKNEALEVQVILGKALRNEGFEVCRVSCVRLYGCPVLGLKVWCKWT